MRYVAAVACVVALGVGIPGVVRAATLTATIRVQSGPELAAAVERAPAGSTIEVAPGTYLNVGVRVGKKLSIVGGSGTVFDGGGRMPMAFDFLRGSSGSELLNVTVTNYHSNTTSQPGMVVVEKGASNVSFGLDSFVGGHTNAMYIAGEHTMIANSHFDDNGYDGINGDGANYLTVSNSTFRGNNLGGFPIRGSSANAAGMKLVHTRGINIQWSDFSSNHATGLWCDLGCDGFVVDYSTSNANANHGFFYEISTDGRLYDDTAIDNAGYGIELSSASHTVGFGNGPNVHGNRAGQIVIKCTDRRHPCGDNKVS